MRRSGLSGAPLLGFLCLGALGGWVTVEDAGLDMRAERELWEAREGTEPMGTAERMELMPLDVYELLSLRKNIVRVNINGQVAVTKATHIFQNNSSATLQAVYRMPLGEGAHLTGYAIWEKGEKLVGVLAARDDAERIYTEVTEQEVPDEAAPVEEMVAVEKWVPQPRDPGLMRLLADNTFETRIYPIWPYDLKQMEVYYSEMLPQREGRVTYTFPLRMASLFKNVIGELEVQIEISDPLPIEDVTCDLPGVEIEHLAPNRVLLKAAHERFMATKDITVGYRLVPSGFVQPTVLCHKAEGAEAGFFGLRLSRPTRAPDARPRDAVILADVSPGMRPGNKGQFVRAAAEALASAVTASESDRVHLLGWGGARSLVSFDGLQPRTPELVAQLKQDITKWVSEGTGGRGELPLADGLREALATFDDTDHSRYVFVLTDGHGASTPEELAAAVRASNAHAASVHVLACGYDDDEAALEAIASAGAGQVHLCLGDHSKSELGRARGSMLQREFGTLPWTLTADDVLPEALVDSLAGSAVHDLTVHFDGGGIRAALPATLGNLPDGGSVFLFGTYREPGEIQLLVSGNLDGELTETITTITLPETREQNRFLGTFWGKERVAELEELHGTEPPAEVKAEIIALSLEHRFVTRHTAFLSLPDRERRQYMLDPTADDMEQFYEVAIEPNAGFGAGVPEWETWILLAVGLSIVGVHQLLARRGS